MQDKNKTAQSPLILRAHRLMEAFAKSDDERDFFLDRVEGFILFVDLSKTQQELDALDKEIKENGDRYCLIPKLTFYEIKKIMEGFVNEKVYDIDTKEKLLDIIQSKEARDNFLEFIYDHLTELEKWQQYYQERSRIRIIEWLRNNNFQFVFEEDLDIPKQLVEKIKMQLFEQKVAKDISQARESLFSKAKTYYSIEALNPRPKRGRPPKQIAKIEVEPQMTMDIYTTITPSLRPFLFTPDIATVSAITFSSKFDSEEEFLASRNPLRHETSSKWDDLAEKLASIRTLAQRTTKLEAEAASLPAASKKIDWSDEDEDDEIDDLEEDFEDDEEPITTKSSKASKRSKIAQPAKSEKNNVPLKSGESGSKNASPKSLPPAQVIKKPVASKAPASKVKEVPPVKKAPQLSKVPPQAPKKSLAPKVNSKLPPAKAKAPITKGNPAASKATATKKKAK